MYIILRHETLFLFPDRVSNSNKVKTHSKKTKIILKLILKNSTDIKSQIFYYHINFQFAYKILTLSSLIFLSLVFWQSFEVRKGNLYNSLEYGKNVSVNIWVSTAQLCHLVRAQTQLILFQKIAIYSQVLSLYEFHSLTIESLLMIMVLLG